MAKEQKVSFQISPEEKTIAQGLDPFEEDKSTDKPETKNPYKLTFISDILEAPPIEWLIEDILFDRTFSILGGYTGYGKSLLGLAIAKSLADGTPLFDRYKVNRTGKVLIVDEENSHSDLKDRMTRMGITKKLPIYFLSFQGVCLDDIESFEYLLEIISQMKPVQVLFDSLVRFHQKNENDASEMSRVMGKFREITNLGVGVMVLHHHNKGMGPLEIRTRGSSDIVGICDVEYALWHEGNNLMMSAVKSRRSHIETIKLSIESSPESLKIRFLGTADDERKMLMLIIDDYLKEQPSSISKILEFLSNNGNSISEKPLRKILQEMNEKGYIRIEIGKKNKKIYFSSGASRTETPELPN